VGVHSKNSIAATRRGLSQAFLHVLGGKALSPAAFALFGQVLKWAGGDAEFPELLRERDSQPRVKPLRTRAAKMRFPA
jgi:hypothetical protein